MSTPETAALYREPFRRGLSDLGYREGSNITLIPRYAEGNLERVAGLVKELVEAKVDVMLLTRPAVPIAQKLAPSIPVVCAAFSDPVAERLVASLARPGVNVTGLSWQSPESAGKRIELIKELIPGVRRVAIVSGEGDPGALLEARANREVARGAGIGLREFSFRDATSLEGALVGIRQMQAQLLIVISGPLPLAHRSRLIAFATEARIPLMSEGREWAEAGALLAYGPDGADVFRRAATYVDKILRGEKAAEIPIEQPNKFELAINRATAKAIGLKVPESLLLRADLLIQ